MALMVVSHDRYFLDSVADEIFDLVDGKIEQYPTNYSGFTELKAQRQLAQERGTTSSRPSSPRRRSTSGDSGRASGRRRRAAQETAGPAQGRRRGAGAGADGGAGGCRAAGGEEGDAEPGGEEAVGF